MITTFQECEYFASPVLLGPTGVVRNLGLPKMTEFEKSLMQSAIPFLQKDIKMGVSFVSREHDIEEKVEDVCAQYLGAIEKQQAAKLEVPKPC